MSCCNTNAGAASGESPAKQGATFQPNVDIFETPNEWVIAADVPGATREGLDLRFEDGVLTVRAGVPTRQAGSDYLVREYPVGDFERTFRVGQGIDPNAISAGLDAGVLTIHLPKSASSRARKIEIKSN